MPQRSGLGRGLDSLIPGSESASEAGGINQVPVDSIQPNPRQPRIRMDPAELSELTESIREHGVLQPLIVTPAEQDGNYVLIAGERRLEAARSAGFKRVPVIIREASDEQRLELALIENIQRADLSPLEEADAYRQLAEDFKLSHEEIALKVGKSRVAVTNTLRLLRLPDGVKNALVEGRIFEGHARALLSLPTPEAQAAALRTILAKDLNVRQVEALVKKITGEKPKRSVKFPSPEISEIEEKLRASLGTKVSLQAGKNGGRLTVYYYSEEELEAILVRLLD